MNLLFLLKGCSPDPLAGLPWERQFEKVVIENAWDKGLAWESLFVHGYMGLLLSVYVDDIKMAWTKHYLEPMWKSLMKYVDLEKPTQFVDQIFS